MTRLATWWLLGLAACATEAAAPPRAVPGVVAARLPVPLAPAGPRLPRTLVPVGYRAQLAIGARITGHMEVTGDLPAASALVWLHGTALAVTRATAMRAGATVELQVDRVGDDLLALQAARPLAAGRWTLALDYSAPIAAQALLPDHLDPADPAALAAARAAYEGDVARGAFREQLGGAAYVFTQFEAMDARRVFPCIDEPDVKVPWQLTFDVAATDVVAGNAAIARETPLPGGRKRVELAPTAPLPSYVVAFAIGPFAIVDAGASRGGVPIRVLVPRGLAGADHALADGQMSARVLDALAAWTGIPYPFGKLDFVAVPRTGNEWAAMENPGLVTMRADFLAGTEGRYAWLEVAAHELAHQWFGDLVTMAWWDDVWLNEGFATWLGGVITTQLDPGWAAGAGLADDRREALAVAQGAVRGHVERQRDVEPYFAGPRAGEVLRMFEGFLGTDALQRATRAYLAAHAGGTATTADLVAAIDAATGGSYAAAFADALDQPRVPEVTSELSCDHGRFALRVWSRPAEPRTVPICVAYDRDGGRGRACALLAAGMVDVPLAARACPTWAMPNADGAGAYRSVLGADALARLAGHWHALTAVERAVVRDELAVGDADVAALLPLASKLVALGDADARHMAVAILAPAVRLVPDALRGKLDAWIGAHLAAAARALPLVGRDREDGDPALVALVAATHDPELVRAALAAAKDLATVSPPYLGSVLALVASADPAAAARVIALLAAIPSTAQRGRLEEAIASEPAIADAVLRDPTQLDALDGTSRYHLLAGICDPARRARLPALADRYLPRERVTALLAEIDACLARRAAVAPAFRAWLTPSSASSP